MRLIRLIAYSNKAMIPIQIIQLTPAWSSTNTPTQFEWWMTHFLILGFAPSPCTYTAAPSVGEADNLHSNGNGSMTNNTFAEKQTQLTNSINGRLKWSK